MPVEIQITQDDIQHAESILLQSGKTFDEERIAFISNLQTIDLQAVPGSGKTTALLAKLLILERKLPFPKGSGILVISHTNAAVDEIKSKIAKYCPKLFSYPNFVGTIQSFVNDFLAKPYYAICFKKKLVNIDTVIYEEKIRLFYRNLSGSSALKNWLRNQRNPLEFLQSIRMDENRSLISEINGLPSSFALGKNTQSYCELVSMKKSFLEEGYLHFEDAYLLAMRYLTKFPTIKTYLQLRFCYIFVDEMQDMDKHQHDLLEKLFFDSGNSSSTYQRIGDKNQAIYNGDAKVENYWIDRVITSSSNVEKRVLKIEGSHRLSPEIASIVQQFSLDPNLRIIGLRDTNEIRPRMILYDNETKSNVVPMFSNIIQTLQQERKIPYGITNGQKASFHAVAWSTVWSTPEQQDHPNKLRLTDFISFTKVANNKNRSNYDTLSCYLEFWDRQSQSLEPIQKNLLYALLRVIRFEGVKNREYGKEKEFTRATLMKFLYRNHPDFYELLKQKLYRWCIGLINNNQENIRIDLQDFIPLLIEKLSRSPSLSDKTHTFIRGSCSEAIRTAEESRGKLNYNVKQYGDIEIKIGSVHSVKGQTHTATLYIESYYGTGARCISGGYEAHRLAGCFNQDGRKIKKKVSQQSAKMVYVGFSRPTHLLCFAVHKDRYAALDCAEYWDIHDLTTEAIDGA